MRRWSGLRGALAAVWRVRPVWPRPAEERERRRDAAAWAWTTRMPGAALAELVWDGDLDTDPPPAGALDELRAGRDGGPRVLCFSAGADGGAADVIVLAVGRRSPHPVRGRVRPGPAATGISVALQTAADDPPDTRLDGDGRFTLPASPAGPLRLVLRRPGAAPLVTEWILTT